MDLSTVEIAAIWIGGLSVFCAGLMYWDKRAAVRYSWRVPERKLLIWAYLGGGLGAKLAQRRFRHKTRKEPFRTFLNASLLFNAITVIILVVPVLRETLFDIVRQFLA